MGIYRSLIRGADRQRKETEVPLGNGRRPWCCTAARIFLCTQDIQRSRYDLDMYVWNALVDIHVKWVELEDAQWVFDEIGCEGCR